MGSENTRSSKYNFPQKLYTKNYNNYSELYTMDKKDLKRDLRKIDQKSRILKLIMLSKAFQYFTQAELKRSLIDHENTWKSAERTADLVNFFFEERNAKPEDFMYRKTDLIDQSIDHWNEFHQWISPNIASGISEFPTL